MYDDFYFEVEKEFYLEAVAHLQKMYIADKKFIIDPKYPFPARSYNFEELERLQKILFPLYWNNKDFCTYKQKLYDELLDFASYLFYAILSYDELSGDAISSAVNVSIKTLPVLGKKLRMDVEAAYLGDPAATKNYSQIIRTYPGFKAVMIQRFAHILYLNGAVSYARELTETVNLLTGIDIHPGAKIGDYFFIDHGNGVVISETVEIGKWVRIYQGVTLGALILEKDNKGKLKRGYKRHPTLKDDVVVNNGAKILGPVTIGSNTEIGPNCWIDRDIPKDSRTYLDNKFILQYKIIKP